MSSSQQNTQTLDESNLFRIMIASDTHLGYLENDQIRGDDSFNTFEEILKISKSEGVDFLLLGGDLFHHHNPSKKTIIRTGNILQKYVYGQRNQKYNIFCYDPNFKNENLSVEVPIFIIHGNHDDPSGFENFSSIDIFSNKELNYFGKINNYEEFDLYPILFVKNNTKIALYGIGYIKDERLYLALQNKKVNFHRPEDYKNWFNILIVHQNRFKGHNIGKNKKSYLPESFIPSFFDLIIWGHEHECFTEPVYNSEVGFHIYQPGSSVATSLIQAESKPKHIGLCEINRDKFRINPIKLETVRPFFYEQFELKSFADQIKTTEDIENILEKKIEDLLNNNTENDNIKNDNISKKKIVDDKSILLPIVRIKVEHTGYSLVRTNTIISKFSNKIANPSDVIQFWKKGEIFNIKKSNNNIDIDLENNNNNNNESFDENYIDTDEELKKFVNENISNYYIEKQKNNLLNTDIFADYLDKAVNGNERHAIEALFRQFYLGGINCLNLNENEINLLKDINVLENPKKDFNDIIDNLINKIDVNNFIVNGGKNHNENINKKNIDFFNKSIHLQSQNNFSNEKAENKIEKDLSSSQKSNFNEKNQNVVNFNNNNKNNNKFKQKSILEILSDSSSNSIYNNKKNIYFDDDEDFMDKSESENSNFNKNKINKKIKKGSGQYKVQPKKLQKKKK